MRVAGRTSVRFLGIGEIEISNNQVENAIRPFVVGRKEWLFADTHQGAEASAIIYSLMETAKANRLRLDDYAKKDAIEKEMGSPLDWRELPEKKASRILLAYHVDFENKEAWISQFDWLMETTMKYKRVFKKYL